MTQSRTSLPRPGVRNNASATLRRVSAALVLAAMALPAASLFDTAGASPRAFTASPHVSSDRRLPPNLGSRRTVRPGEANSLNPQPLPPGGRITVKPGDAVTLSPQPLPPGARMGGWRR